MATDLIEKTRNELEARLEELRPMVDEANRLQRALDALTGAVGDAVAGAAGTVAGAAESVAERFGSDDTPKKRSGGRRSSGNGRRSSGNGRRRGASSTGRKPGRRKGSGTRAAQANELVKKRPGITIPELAQEMGIKQNYLYRVMPGLQEEGKVVKRDKAWYPA